MRRAIWAQNAFAMFIVVILSAVSVFFSVSLKSPHQLTSVTGFAQVDSAVPRCETVSVNGFFVGQTKQEAMAVCDGTFFEGTNKSIHIFPGEGLHPVFVYYRGDTVVRVAGSELALNRRVVGKPGDTVSVITSRLQSPYTKMGNLYRFSVDGIDISADFSADPKDGQMEISL